MGAFFVSVVCGLAYDVLTVGVGEKPTFSPKRDGRHTDESTENGLDFHHGFALAQLN